MNRRLAGEELYRQKFIDFGLSERFEFIRRDWTADHNGVCSAECKKEKTKRQLREAHRGRRDGHRHRAKKYGCEYDPTVKLDKLIERDGLRCAICGQMCDPNDHSWSKYSGPMYPSIDHIIPMSKGGGHTWDNVQVAHIICNSEKGDSTEEVGA